MFQDNGKSGLSIGKKCVVSFSVPFGSIAFNFKVVGEYVLMTQLLVTKLYMERFIKIH